MTSSVVFKLVKGPAIWLLYLSKAWMMNNFFKLSSSRKMSMLKRIISGGQTGVDRAGLDAAIRYGIPHGGSIPRGRRTEDGVLPNHYNLTELSSTSYPARTEKNVVDSDATVIFSHGPLSNGSLLTQKKALLHNRPVLHLDLRRVDVKRAVNMLVDFVRTKRVEVLNIAGPRASGDPYIYGATFSVLEVALPVVVTIDPAQ